MASKQPSIADGTMSAVAPYGQTRSKYTKLAIPAAGGFASGTNAMALEVGHYVVMNGMPVPCAAKIAATAAGADPPALTAQGALAEGCLLPPNYVSERIEIKSDATFIGVESTDTSTGTLWITKVN